MTLEESKDRAAETRPVEKDKFDRHMERARRSDIKSKQEVFVLQSAQKEARIEKVNGIKPSVY